MSGGPPEGAGAWPPLRGAAPRGGAWLGPGAMALAAGLTLAAPAATATAGWLVLGVGLVLLGLPHGAVDHRLPRWAGRPGSPVGLVAGYAALAVAGTALFALVPAVGLPAFLAITVLHWGQGELWWLVRLGGRAAPRGRASALAVVLARGGLPVLAPLALQPGATTNALARLLGPLPGPPPAVGGLAQGLAGVALAGALGAAAWAASRDHGGPGGLRTAGARRDLAELGVLLACLAVVPPVLAVGTYYLAWHAARHLVRLSHAQPGPAPGARRLAAAALPCTAVALAGAGAGAALLGGAGALVPAAFALTFGLTLPHALVVLWMDDAPNRRRVGASLPAWTASTRRWCSSPGWPPGRSTASSAPGP